jgi:hypothetical protein
MVFNNEDSSVDKCISRLKVEFALVILRAKRQRQSSMKQLLESLH